MGGGRDEAEKAEGEQRRPSVCQEEDWGSPFREQGLRCGRVDEVMGRGGREWQGCVRNASYFWEVKRLRPVGARLTLRWPLCLKAYVCYVFCNQMWLVVWGEFIHRFGRRMNNEFKVKSP